MILEMMLENITKKDITTERMSKDKESKPIKTFCKEDEETVREKMNYIPRVLS